MSENHPLPRVVLDTNVYVNGTILARGVPFEVLEAWRRQAYVLVTSKAIIAEIERVLRYPRIRNRYAITDQDVARLIESLQTEALVVAGDYEVSGVSTDPDDDKFLACALESQPGYIVTGDPDLLNLKQYHGIVILKPYDFLKQLSTILDDLSPMLNKLFAMESDVCLRSICVIFRIAMPLNLRELAYYGI